MLPEQPGRPQSTERRSCIRSSVRYDRPCWRHSGSDVLGHSCVRFRFTDRALAPLRPCVRRSVTTLTMSGFCTRPAACRNRHGRRLRADRPRLPELVERLAARMLDVAGHVGAAHGPTQPAGEDRCALGADSGEADDTRPGMVYSSRLDLSAEGWCRYPKRRHVMSMASTARAMAKKSGSGACQSTGTVSTRPGSNGVV